MTNVKNTIRIVCACAAMTASSHAATIAWGSATLITGDSDVSTNGTLVEAYNINGTSTTLNGVTFTGSPTTIDSTGTLISGTATFGSNFSYSASSGGYLYRDFEFNGSGTTTVGTPTGAFAGLSANYQGLLQGGMIASGNGTSFTLTMNNLVIGQQYEIQIWGNDSRIGTNNRGMTITDGPALDFNNGAGNGVLGGVGQWLTGTFTADATSQSFTATGPAGNSPTLNAFQLRAIPEPSVALLGGLGLFGLLRRRRRHS